MSARRRRREPARSRGRGRRSQVSAANPAQGLANGRQTIAIVLSFAVMVFGVLGWVWASLDGRVARCEQQVSAEVSHSAAHRATVEVRLANIEKHLEEIRQDVKALR